MLDKKLLEASYTSYGFEPSTSSDEDISIFIYRKSRYFGVDIIPNNYETATLTRANKIREEYSKFGYAVNYKEINNNLEAEIELFKSFFSFDSTRQRITRKYNDFTAKQNQSLLGFNYQYVESPFELHNDQKEEKNLFEIIERRITSNRPELIIIEAAAGYGKTCTAFEILNKVIDKTDNQLPIFTELARNRGANIFRYILLDEIDLEFPSLNSSLVIKEIKNGRIPLIIDGFDELLEKVDTDSSIDNSFDDVESMLDTIGNLLEGKTKIILTTRKTAIFTGLEFEKWLIKWNEKFDLSRITLKEPRIKDWLGDFKYNLVKEKLVPIQYLANPVLLTFLKHLDYDLFYDFMDKPDQLVQQYFEGMLEREKERQDLIMTVENQMLLFRNVAKNLLELDSTLEDKEFFKLIILEDNKKLLEDTKNLYSGVNKRTIEQLVDTLCTHALLDRKGRDQNQIGFINDFIFGTFIGQNLINLDEELNSKSYSAYMIELAVTAFRVQNKENKELLWDKVQSIIYKFQNETSFIFDVYLKESLVREYSEISIHDLTFFGVSFKSFPIISSIFLNCYFKNCIFDNKIFKGVSFINCTFNNCKVMGGELIDQNNEITTIKCIDEKSNILLQSTATKYQNETPSLVSDFEKEILYKIWSPSNTKGHHLTKLIQSFDKSLSRKVHHSLKTLGEQGFLEIRGIHVYFVINKINEIKKILET